MRVRLIIESDVPAEPTAQPARALQKKFSRSIMVNLKYLQESIPGEIVFISSEVVEAGSTDFNIRKSP